MQQLKKNFTQLIIFLFSIVLILVALSMVLAKKAMAAEPQTLPVPVSINALMVTLVDHSAHYIWDYAAMEREISADEWRTVEYYAIQLAGASSLITLGGSGELDGQWVRSPQWLEFSRIMSGAALVALESAKGHDKVALSKAGDQLIDSCQGCHDVFKPGIPTEGYLHQPDYDYLYHLFR